MSIGLSLPFDYLAGTGETADARCFSESFGKPCDCLVELKDNGVGSIEIGGFGPDAAADTLLGVAQHILGSGMRLTLHGYQTGNAAGHLFDNVYKQLLPTLNYIRDQQENTVMVVHALADPAASYHSMVEFTTRSLKRLAESIQTCSLPVRIGLEINRYHGLETPGITDDGLLEIAQHMGSSDIGFCWDMGHTASSVLQKKLSEARSPEFLSKVIHTHLHGLSRDGDTHRPLTESSSHIASGVSQLTALGYGGTYNLEFYPMRWGSEHTVRDEILGSIRCLQEILNKE